MIAFLSVLDESHLKAICVEKNSDGSRYFVEFSAPEEYVSEVETMISEGTPVFQVEFDQEGGATISTYSNWSKLN